MAVTGRKPKDGPIRHRNAPTHDWTEVEDVRFEGESPDLPSGIDWTTQTRAWYEVVRHLPHAVLWTAGEWQEIATTALLHNDVWTGVTTRAPELRLREKALGLTADARRDLRIRYVATRTSAEETAEEKPTNVLVFDASLRPRDNALDS